MERFFKLSLPNSLYCDHYELSKMTANAITPEEWRRYLKANDRFILTETSLITEANARAALKRMGEGKTMKGEAQVLKSLLDRSEQINKQNKQQHTFIIHSMPDRREIVDDSVSSGPTLEDAGLTL